MQIPYVRTALFGLLTLLVATASRAESILDYVPDDALGFAVVRNLSATNAKMERVIALFQDASPMPIPAPLPVIKAATGLGAGVDEQGDAVLALLPGDHGITDPRPLLLVSISDYAQFATSINGDVSGEICRVTIAGEEILAAKLDKYAALMNVEHRDQLQAFLASGKRTNSSVEALSGWLARTDVAIVLTRVGIDLITDIGKANKQAEAGPQLVNENLRQAQQTLAMYEGIRELLGIEIAAVGAGLAIDDDANVRLLSQAVLSDDYKATIALGKLPSAASPYKGYSDQPYVAAIGGLLPKGFADSSAILMRDLLKANPQSHGFENLTDQDWQNFEDSWRAYLAGISSVSVIAYLGADEDPLVSNIYGILNVESAAAYLASYTESIKKWNSLLKLTTSDIALEYELTDEKVAGREGLLTTINLGEAADDPNVPMIKFIIDSLLGEDGQLRIYLVPANDKTVVFGIDTVEDIAAGVESVADGETGLSDSASIQQTLKLIDSPAAWTGVVSPQGCVEWVLRVYTKLLAQLGPAAPELPEYPDTPPVGFGLSLSKGRMTAELVWPVEALEGLAAYIKKLQGSF
jgi:hypothetical protein